MGIRSRIRHRYDEVLISAGLRVARNLMIDKDKQLMFGEFETKDGTLALLVGRGERADDVYSPGKAVEGIEAGMGTQRDELERTDQLDLEIAAKRAMKMMKRAGTERLNIYIDRTGMKMEPIGAIWAVGDEATRLAERSRELGASS